MQPASNAAYMAFHVATGAGAREVPPAVLPAGFAARLESGFNARPLPIRAVRSFEIQGEPNVLINTDGRRPSSATVRAIKATVSTLTHLYGRCPHPRLTLYLVDNPVPKTLPRTGAVTTAHVNSGFSQGSDVVVFRRSEMHRTIVHELIHVWRTHSLDRAQAQATAARELGAPARCLLTEAFVEAVTWLVHGGFCSGGLDPSHALRAARAYLRVPAPDDGRTNGWAYFVGKALLVADGGRAFSARFFPHGRGRRLDDAAAFSDLLALMRKAQNALGGRELPLAPDPGSMTAPVCMCNCSLGPAFVT